MGKKKGGIDFSEINREMWKHYYNESVDRGKAIGVLLPLINQEDMIDLLAELYNYRNPLPPEFLKKEKKCAKKFRLTKKKVSSDGDKR